MIKKGWVAMLVISFFNKMSSIKNKIFSVTLLLLLLFCLTGLLFSHYLTKIYEDNIYQHSAESLLLSSTVLDEELNNIEKLSFKISTDPFIQLYLENMKEIGTDYQFYRAKTQLVERMVNFVNEEKYITSLQVIDARGEIHVAGFERNMSEQIDQMMDAVYQAKGGNV